MGPASSRTRLIRYANKSLLSRIIISYLYWFAPVGNVYISDNQNHRIRMVTISVGVITTVVGTGTAGFGGDGGAATSALIYHPNGFVLDSSGIPYYIR